MTRTFRNIRSLAELPQLMGRAPVQRSRPPSRPILSPLPLDNNPKLLLKSPLSDVNYEPGDKNRRAHHDQQEKQNLLKSIDSTEIDGPQP